jgi:glycosyltransferase involved in cell wall biosynthesis
MSATATLPSITAIVSTKDRPEEVRRAARSILGQSYEGDIECIVVFDQSDPIDLGIESNERRRLRAVVNEGTPGLAGSRNFGVGLANGDLVAFSDDDDEWYPDKLQLQVEALDANPGVDLVTTGILIHYRGRTISRVAPRELIELRDLLRERLVELHPSGYLVRRPALQERIGPIDESLPGGYAEDYEWLLRAARVAPILAIRRPLINVYWPPPEKSHFTGRWGMMADALTAVVDRYPEFASEPKGMSRIAGQVAFARAGAGERRLARRWAARSIRANPLEPRGYLAFACATGLVRNDTILGLLRKRGRGF